MANTLSTSLRDLLSAGAANNASRLWAYYGDREIVIDRLAQDFPFAGAADLATMVDTVERQRLTAQNLAALGDDLEIPITDVPMIAWLPEGQLEVEAVFVRRSRSGQRVGGGVTRQRFRAADLAQSGNPNEIDYRRVFTPIYQGLVSGRIRGSPPQPGDTFQVYITAVGRGRGRWQ